MSRRTRGKRPSGGLKGALHRHYQLLPHPWQAEIYCMSLAMILFNNEDTGRASMVAKEHYEEHNFKRAMTVMNQESLMKI